MISTTPKANSPVDKGEKVNLLVSKGPNLTKVPDVEGLYLSTAKKKLNKLGFKVKSREAPSNEYLPGLIISQSVKVGRKVDASKTTITLVVAVALEDQPKSSSSSSSKKATFKLADLTGKSLEDAQSYAKSKKLNVKVEKDYSDSVDSSDVISTDPAAGSEVSEGDTLTITVSKGLRRKRSRRPSRLTTRLQRAHRAQVSQAPALPPARVTMSGFISRMTTTVSAIFTGIFTSPRTRTLRSLFLLLRVTVRSRLSVMTKL